MSVVQARPRKRAGSYNHFVKLYEPIDPPSGETVWEWDELPVLPDSTNLIWTVLDCDGKLYVTAGIHYVNRLGYVVTKNAWDQTEFMNPGYRW